MAILLGTSPGGSPGSYDKDKNVIAAVMSILVIATLATALAQPKWFSVKGGSCTKKYIGLQELFYASPYNYPPTMAQTGYNIHNRHAFANLFENTTTDDYRDMNKSKSIDVEDNFTAAILNQLNMGMERQKNNSVESRQKALRESHNNCVTPEIVSLQRLIILLCFFAIIVNLVQFFLDTLGTSKKWVNSFRSHAVGSIIGVIMAIMIIGISYLISNLLEKEQKTGSSSNAAYHHVEVRFELSYYLVTLSGLIGLVASSCNLLRKPRNFYLSPIDLAWMESNGDQTAPFDDNNISSIWTQPPTVSSIVAGPPPPPYTP